MFEPRRIAATGAASMLREKPSGRGVLATREERRRYAALVAILTTIRQAAKEDRQCGASS